MGVLYLVVLGAAKLVSDPTSLPILSPPFAVFAMLVLSIFTVLLAIMQNYQPLAVFAILGGFAAPLIISTDSHNHVLLFSIYTLLNLEILAISFKREWRVLNVIGFILTVAIGAAWGLRNWKPEFFSSIEPFLLIFLATYTVISLNIGKGERNSDEYRLFGRVPDFFLSLSTPFAFFFLQMKVVAHFKYGMALTCLGLGILHLVIGALLSRKNDLSVGSEFHSVRKNLSRFHMLLCILFSNLIIPYIFEDKISSAIWAVEGAFLIFAACRNGDYRMLTGGAILHVGAMWLYAREFALLNLKTDSRLSPIFISGVIFVASHLVSGFYASRFNPVGNPEHKKWEKSLQKSWNLSPDFSLDGSWMRSVFSWAFTILGTLLWWRVIYDQIPRLGLPWFTTFSVLCITALAGSWMSIKFNWRAAKFPLVLVSVLAFYREVIYLVSPFYGMGIVGFILNMTENLYPLAWHDILFKRPLPVWVETISYLAGVGGSLYLLRQTIATLFSKIVLSISLFTGLTLSARAAHSLGMLLKDSSNIVWGQLFFVLPILALLFYLRSAFAKNDIIEEYKCPIAVSTGAFLIWQAWDFCMSFSYAGVKVFNVFIPVLNPLELRQVVFLISLFLWILIFVYENSPFEKWIKQVQLGMGVIFFLWINQVAIRLTFWYWDAPPYNLWRVFATPHCQSITAIMWGVFGLWAILRGKGKRSRVMWSAGAALLAMDMIKLILVDLRGAATLTRVVAFLVLGGLFILIGWAAPLPPKEEDSKA